MINALDQLLADLRALCAQPSSAGQQDEFASAADLVARMLRQSGLTTIIAPTPGAPVVIGWRAGRSPFNLLLYHHYDTSPPGPWRAWSHEPFQLAERDGYVYGRGVAHGKGPLVAHLAALRTLMQQDGELPCGVVIVAEGEYLSGSPHLAQALASWPPKLKAHACLATGGERDVDGRPFCYSGSKGLLRVCLTARGSRQTLPAGLASSVHNPLWRLAWVLNQIKGEDEDIRIEGFYDSVTGPSRDENAALRRVRLDEAGRLAAWNAPAFLFSMSGSALIRAEVTLPTCNLTSLISEPYSELPGIPSAAMAMLDFQLVPQQLPDDIFCLLREHLRAKNIDFVDVEMLPGAYPPTRTDANPPFIEQIASVGAHIYGAPLTVLPSGPFTQPLQIFVQQFGVPVASVGLSRYDSAVCAPDEHLPLEDLVRHSHLLSEIMLRTVLKAAAI